MDQANQRLETGYEPIHVDVWRPDLRLNGEAIYTKKFTDPDKAIAFAELSATTRFWTKSSFYKMSREKHYKKGFVE